MIREIILTTAAADGTPHIAPMGVHLDADRVLILPFRPSTTLDNLQSGQLAVVNYVDDVRVFAGCVTGRRDWPLSPLPSCPVPRLGCALAHAELALQNVEDDPLRPRLHCRVLREEQHRPFRGFNRAQHAVLEAAILVSRLGRLPRQKIQLELDYLRIGLDKTCGPDEREAWNWLMEAITDFYATAGDGERAV